MKLFNIISTSFEKFDNTIRTYLSKALGAIGQQYSNSQIFSIIFEGIKGVMQNVMFYIEDAFTEQNIDTAYRKSSIYSLAKLSGFEPFYGTAATGILNVNVSLTGNLPENATKIYIKDGSKIVNNETGLYYTIMLPSDFYVIDLTKPLASYQISIVQGTLRTSTYSSVGESLETIHIVTNGAYDKEYTRVSVDGITYTNVSNLYDMSKNGLECVINAGYDNELDILFGNNIHGKRLTENQVVTVDFLNHSGEAGNIYTTDTYDFELHGGVFDNMGNIVKNPDFIKFTLAGHISGGSNSDSIETVRNMIGYNSRSLVLANEDNFRLFFKRFSFIGQTNIWCENNSLQVNAVCLNNTTNSNITNEEFFNLSRNNKLLLSNEQKEMIINTLSNSNKAFAGVTLNFIDPIICKYGIVVYIKLYNNDEAETTKANITKDIIDYFKYLPENTTFISKSDIIKTILNNNTNINAIDISFISDNNERAKYNKYYYKYEKIENNYILVKTQYSETLGLDNFGNINLTNKFEIPVLSNDIMYTLETGDIVSNLPAIQYIFM